MNSILLRRDSFRNTGFVSKTYYSHQEFFAGIKNNKPFIKIF